MPSVQPHNDRSHSMPLRLSGDSALVRGPQSAYMSRCQQVVPEGKDDKPQRPGELVPLHNVVALLVVLSFFPRASPPPDEVGHGENILL
jgi:hypothetical protein